MPLHLRVGSAPASWGRASIGRLPRAVAGDTRSSIGRPPPHAGRVPKHRRAPCPPRPNERPSPSCARSSPTARTMIVSEYRGLKVKEIAEIRRALRKQDVTLPRRQEPADADRRRRLGGRRRSARSSSARRRSPSANDEAGTAKAVLDATRPYNRIVRITAASSATGRSTPTTSPGWRPCRRARCCWPSWPAGCRRRWRRWPACSPPRCATWATPCSRSPSRRPRDRGA